MFRTLPPFGGDQRQVSEVVRGLMDGKSNNTGTFDFGNWWCYDYHFERQKD